MFWAGVCVLSAAITVQCDRTGVDVLGLLIAAFMLLLVERTLGDWIAESLGPAATAFVFAAVAASGVWYLTDGVGRAKAQRVFAAAEARGYHTMFVTLDDQKDIAGDNDETGAVSNAVRDASDAVGPATGGARPLSPPSRPTSARGSQSVRTAQPSDVPFRRERCFRSACVTVSVAGGRRRRLLEHSRWRLVAQRW